MIDDRLLQQIASDAAERATHVYGKKKSKGDQLALWQSYYDNALAALMVLDEIVKGRAERREYKVSLN